MGKHRNFDDEDIFYASWTDAIQEYISNLAVNLKLYRVNTTTIGIRGAGTDVNQVSVGLGGPWRYRSTAYNLAINGAVGTKDIYAVAVTANDFEGPGKDPDETDYKFELRAVAHEAVPGEVAYFRKAGEVDWDGTKITAVRQTINSVTGAMIEVGVLSSGSGSDINWTQDEDGNWQAQIKGNSVGSNEIAAGAVGASEIEDASITDTEIAAANKNGAAATPSLRTLGTGSKEAAAGNDSRLSDERTPKANSVVTSKIADGNVTREKLASDAKPMHWYPPKIINAEDERNSTSFGLLGSGDVVANVVLPSNGLIVVLYDATWRGQTEGASVFAAIFLDEVQMKVPDTSAGEPIPQEATKTPGSFLSGYFARLNSYWNGLVSNDNSGDATGNEDYGTGTAVGHLQGNRLSGGGPCYIYADAGTYDVSIRFRASAGVVRANTRRLWVGVIANGS